MKRTFEQRPVIAVITGTLLFNFIFWQEGLGLNAIIFTTFLVTALLLVRPQVEMSWPLWASYGGIILSCLTLIINHTVLAKLMLAGSLISYIGLLHEQRLNALFFSLAAGVRQVMLSPFKLVTAAIDRSQSDLRLRKSWRILKLISLPLLVTVLFLLLYRAGNPVLHEMVANVLTAIAQYFADFFEKYPFTRFVLIALAFIFLTGIFYSSKYNFFKPLEKKQSDAISRKAVRKRSLVTFCNIQNPLALKTEYQRAVILLALLNVLLLLVNVLDVTYIGFFWEHDVNFSMLVHQGVYALCTTIFLSILLLVFFFRGNLNFYRSNRLLRQLSIAWIFQNLILAITTGTKNFYYVAELGLTYKRIGVLAFLLVVAAGLAFIFIKIQKRKSIFYLLKANAWSVYAMFLLLSLVNWDAQIAWHNLSRTASPIDYDYIFSLSDKALPALIANEEQLKHVGPQNAVSNNYSTYAALLQRREIKFIYHKQQQTHLSWNYAEQQIQNQVVKSMDLTSEK